MEKEPILDSLQKTKNFREKQESIIRSISKKCTQSSFVESIPSEGPQIKHFKLEDGTHVYSINSSTSFKPSRLISSVELPNIAYFANHWNPMLVPDKKLHQANGTFIYVNPDSVCYTSIIDGKILFEAGYNLKLDNSDKVRFFCNFGYKHYGNTFNELPKNVDTILQLLDNRYKLYGMNYPRLIKNYENCKNILAHLENGTVNELQNNIIDDSNIVVDTEKTITEPNSVEPLPPIKKSINQEMLTTLDKSINQNNSSIPGEGFDLKSNEISLPSEKQDFRTSIRVTDYIPPINTTPCSEKHSTLKNKLLGLFKKHSAQSRDDE